MQGAVSDEVYQGLVAKLRRADTLDGVAGLLGWDEQVNLPPGGRALRAEQLALLAELRHAAAADPEIGRALSLLEPAALDPDQRAVVGEARREHDRATRLPPGLVRRKAALDSRGYHLWVQARAAADFGRFAPLLKEQVELAREEAACLGWGSRPYDYLIDRHDPGLDASTIADWFAELQDKLLPLARVVMESAERKAPPPLVGFALAGQEALAREVTGRMGFDYERGRLDVSVHPFCGGSGQDVRMTTRFDEQNPLDSLFSALHEAGHGLYEQGLSVEHRGTALGMPAGMAVHESQSRLWENQVGRSRAFWRYLEPRLRQLFPDPLAALSSEDLYRAANRVSRQPIRVDADEVTYNLHILLRFQLERGLFDGSLTVEALPTAWNRLSRDLLGYEPANQAEGVLQDVHWSGGGFGYFPSYAIGNMIAAQLWYALRDQVGSLDDDFAAGDFARLLQWLRARVHRTGRRWGTLRLVREATGQDLSPACLVRYLAERYLPLYS